MEGSSTFIFQTTNFSPKSTIQRNIQLITKESGKNILIGMVDFNIINSYTKMKKVKVYKRGKFCS